MFREPFPILSVSDVQRSVHFYCELFGFSPSYRWPTEDLTAFAFLKLPPLDIGVATLNEAEGQIMRRLAKHNLDSASLWKMLMEPAPACPLRESLNHIPHKAVPGENRMSILPILMNIPSISQRHCVSTLQTATRGAAL